ncbi:MAG: hypothetical protein ACYSVY_27745, partial [Planctomycetota bacterium]
MKPTLFPAGGGALQGLPGTLKWLGQVAGQAGANANIETIGGMGAADHGPGGVKLFDELRTQLYCFEITGCWESVNRPPAAGPSQGLFWSADAMPV